MNIGRKIVPIEIGERKLGLVMDFESAIVYQEATGDSIFDSIENIVKYKDLKSLAYLIAATLRDEEDKLVGLDFVKKLDLISSMEYFMTKLGELVENSLPKQDSNKSKKK